MPQSSLIRSSSQDYKSPLPTILKMPGMMKRAASGPSRRHVRDDSDEESDGDSHDFPTAAVTAELTEEQKQDNAAIDMLVRTSQADMKPNIDSAHSLLSAESVVICTPAVAEVMIR
jgi:hypothetical protein